jgi:cytochrome d ubiquinol oxidase subunit II
MGALWFGLLTLILTVFVVLDGFDMGVGIIHLFVAKDDDERRMVLNAIGPVWNGNEVWLIMAGGALFLSFPKVYAASFSGFYLGLFLLLWLLIGRGLALELRPMSDSPLWHTFWDVVFAGSSLGLAVALGMVWGNLLRGVPLNADGFFFLPFFTSGLPVADAGLLDWYTILMAAAATVVLTVYGAAYLAMKTNGQVSQRATRIVVLGRWPVLLFVAGAVAASALIQPVVRTSYGGRSYGWFLPFVGFLGLLGIFYYGRRAGHAGGFVSVGLLIIGLVSSTSFGLYPNVLIANTGESFSLTVTNAAATVQGLRIAAYWFAGAMVLVILYSVYTYRAFRGKITRSSIEGGYY